MRIHLHSDVDGPKVSFDAREIVTDERPPTKRKGLVGWFERQAFAYKHFWHTGEGRLVRAARSVWDRLQRLGAEDEPLLAHLRAVDTVEITHPATWPEAKVRKLWEAYLASRRRRHGLWFVVNAVVSPLTVVLTPLPGPNLIGYWFAYRAFHHGLILLGLRKVARGEVPATFHPTEAPPPDAAPGLGEDRNEQRAPALETGAK